MLGETLNAVLKPFCLVKTEKQEPVTFYAGEKEAYRWYTRLFNLEKKWHCDLCEAPLFQLKDKKVLVLDCKHVFHKTCIEEYFAQDTESENSLCLNCKRETKDET